MNKVLIPAILSATILIAGIFAIVDVDRAMAGHIPNINTGTITTDEILDGTILTGDISADTILAGDIATGAVGTLEIADNVITGADIAALGIDAAGDFAANVVNSAALADAIALPTSLTVGVGGTAITTIVFVDITLAAAAFTNDIGGAPTISGNEVIVITGEANQGDFACWVTFLDFTGNDFNVACSGVVVGGAANALFFDR